MENDKDTRTAFRKMVARQHGGRDIPPSLFNMNERTRVYQNTGLEKRYQDFAQGCFYAATELKKVLYEKTS